MNVNTSPIVGLTEDGVETSEEQHAFDAIVFATGFDAMTGTLTRMDIRGREGLSLKEKWEAGPKTYLGLMSAGFPNLFMITGPGSPSVLSNMMVSIEQHVDWVTDCIDHIRSSGNTTVTRRRRRRLGQHVNDVAHMTLYPKANSWYMGANIPGKPRLFLPYMAASGPIEISVMTWPGRGTKASRSTLERTAWRLSPSDGRMTVERG